ncbi:MAG: hypothetical protein ACKVVP_14490 [Chloroflexota bacterium]
MAQGSEVDRPGAAFNQAHVVGPAHLEAHQEARQSLNYRAPAYLGDTLTARVEVLSLKTDKPVCQLKFEVINQDGLGILDGDGWTYTMLPEPSTSTS